MGHSDHYGYSLFYGDAQSRSHDGPQKAEYNYRNANVNLKYIDTLPLYLTRRQLKGLYLILVNLTAQVSRWLIEGNWRDFQDRQRFYGHPALGKRLGFSRILQGYTVYTLSTEDASGRCHFSGGVAGKLYSLWNSAIPLSIQERYIEIRVTNKTIKYNYH